MKKNLLFTFFLLCLLPLYAFAQPTSFDVTVTKPTNCYIEVSYTSSETSLVTSKMFSDIEGYNGVISVIAGSSLTVTVTPITSYAFEKTTINRGEPIIQNPYTFTNVTEELTIESTVVKMHTFTITKPLNCNIEVEYFEAPLISSDKTVKTITSADPDVILKVKSGNLFSVKVIPASGYAFKELSVSSNVTYENPYTISSVEADKIITASVVGVQTITVTEPVNHSLKVDYIAPLGSTSLSKTFTNQDSFDGMIDIEKGTGITVTVIPDEGYEFSNIHIGPDVYTSNPKTVNNITQDMTIISVVEKKKYLITIPPSPNGTISVTKNEDPVPTGSYIEHGSELLISATPFVNHDLTALTVNGAPFTSGNTITVTGSLIIQATFTYVAPKYAITFVQPANGKLTVRKKVLVGSEEAYMPIATGDQISLGTKLYLYPDPDDNYLIYSFMVNGIPVEDKTNPPVIIEVGGPTTIAVQFVIAQQMITFTPPVNGTFTVKNGSKFINSGDLVDRGTTLSLEAFPKATYKFRMWWDENRDSPREITVGNSNVNISAEFVLLTGIDQIYSDMNVYAFSNAIYINGVTTDISSVSVVDMAGKVVYNSKPELGQTIINPVSRGIYIVVVKGNKGTVSTKVIVK